MNEWTVLDDGYIQCGERKFYVGSNISGEIVSTHNAALAAEREKTVLATQMVHIESKRANEAVEALREIERDSNGWEKSIADAALEKIGYPLPNGRTK